jgi:putative methionine-R-sulfoxide reductase with GAF domain
MLNPTDLVHGLQDMRDQGYLSDALLRHAVRTIAGSDDRFDWVGAFLLREDGVTLWLHDYVGAPAEYAEIPVGVGVAGAAVSAKENRTVGDVTKVDDYHPCSPEIQSELVVLIRAGDQVFGGLDVGSEQPSVFTAADESAVEAIAEKLAEQLVAERR